MSEYNEGDLVEAVKTEIASSTRFRGVLALVENANHVKGFVLKAQGYEPMLQWLEDRGFELTVIEKAKPVLPTEPGWYVDSHGEVWRLSSVRNWHLAARLSEPMVLWESELLISLPLTRLEPEAETAKKVLARVDRFYGYRDRIDLLATVAAEFGVTS